LLHEAGWAPKATAGHRHARGADAPGEFEMAYVNDESRRRLL
jgi:hypothetical protein